MRANRVTACGCAVLLAVVVAVGCSPPDQTAPASQASAPATQAAAPAQAPVAAPMSPSGGASDLPPLPPGVNNAVRPPDVVRAVYEFAARHPEVLHYVPCYCGCQRAGHKDNDDCFVAKRDAGGHVTEWETHALGCEVCIDVAKQAMDMTNHGASISAIRDAIQFRYGKSEMATPMPAH